MFFFKFLYLSSEAGITVEEGILGYPELESVLPEVDAVLVLEAVGVGRAPVHQLVDHVLVLNTYTRKIFKTVFCPYECINVCQSFLTID